MFIDFNKTSSDAFDCDVCIIGGGAAGITMALEFEGRKTKIILVESGDFELNKKTQDLYKGSSSGLPYWDLDVTRLRFLGGSTNHWGGWNMEFSEMAIKHRPWVPHSGWPIGLKDLVPYYKRALPLLGLKKYLFDENVWQHINRKILPLNKKLITTRFWQIKSPATNFNTDYRIQIEKSKNIYAILNANIIEFKSNKSSKIIESIKIASLSGKMASIRSQKFVLACGGIENVRILLNSKNIMKNGLGNQNDLVGRFFMEHPGAGSGIVYSDDPDKVFNPLKAFLIDGVGIKPSTNLSENIQINEKLLEASITVRRIPLKNKKNKSKRLLIITRSEQAPNPESRIMLISDKDALGCQRVQLDWKMTSLDKRTFRRIGEVFGNEISRLKLGSVKIHDFVLNPNPNQWTLGVGSNHHIGTTRMSMDPKSGVVDPNCLVHGLSNLYIAGSSVFPTSGMNNPTFTIVAMAIRLADHLKAKL